MKVNIRKIKKYRKFTEEVKRKVVADFESGACSTLELSRMYSCTQTTIYRWIYKYSNYNEVGCRIVEMKESLSQKASELQKRVSELEQIVGQKQIQIDYLEKLIDIAKDELNVDIKKNSSTPQSTGSRATGKK
ncbi:MAG: transposase [Cyclobacteriaceae bacterium]